MFNHRLRCIITALQQYNMTLETKGKKRINNNMKFVKF